MGTFFIAIYDWMGHLLFSSDLNTFLCGGDINEEVQNAPNLLIPIGIVMAIITLIGSIPFYFGPTSSSRRNSWLAWLLQWLITGVVSFLAGLAMVSYYARHAAEDIVPDDGFSSGDYFGFSLDNMFLCLIFFFILSMIFMLFSYNCHYTPFRSRPSKI